MKIVQSTGVEIFSFESLVSTTVQRSKADLKIHHELLQQTTAEASGMASRTHSRDLIIENVWGDLKHAMCAGQPGNMSELEEWVLFPKSRTEICLADYSVQSVCKL